MFRAFNKYDYEFYNYPSGELLDSNDNHFIDGNHGGEFVYANILIDIFKKHSILNEVIDIDKLNNDLKNKKNDFILYK